MKPLAAAFGSVSSESDFVAVKIKPPKVNVEAGFKVWDFVSPPKTKLDGLSVCWKVEPLKSYLVGSVIIWSGFEQSVFFSKVDDFFSTKLSASEITILLAESGNSPNLETVFLPHLNPFSVAVVVLSAAFVVWPNLMSDLGWEEKPGDCWLEVVFSKLIPPKQENITIITWINMN